MLRLQKHEFNRNLVKYGEIITLHTGEGTGVESSRSKWHTAFKKAKAPEFSLSPRLVNRYPVGADPEFVFSQKVEGLPYILEARSLGLRPGMFCGADGNGVLVEVRPKAYRSCVKVTASILDSLRWLVRKCPTVLNTEFLSGAFLFGFPIGGHVHFGRKRPTRPREVLAMDSLMDALMREGVFSQEQQKLRMQGVPERRIQGYGEPGEYRLQQHGYEYRSFPSWLDSPELTFLILTLSKLVVYCPELLEYWPKYLSQRVMTGKEAILNLLAFYKNHDDDAKLAHWLVMQRGLPKSDSTDFKAKWGLEFNALHPVEETYFPSSMVPETESIGEIFEYFRDGKALVPREPKPTWKPVTVPKGLVLMGEAQGAPQRLMGAAEILQDLVVKEDFQVNIYPEDVGDFRVSSKLAKHSPKWLTTFRKHFPKATCRPNWTENTFRWIGIPKQMRNTSSKQKAMRDFLTSGVFPIWHIKNAENALAWKPEKIKERIYGKYVLPPKEIK